MPHPIIKAKIDEFEEKFTKSIPNKNGTIRNPFLMFDCDGGIVNMPYNILKSFFSTTLDAAYKAGKEEQDKEMEKDKYDEAIKMVQVPHIK